MKDFLNKPFGIYQLYGAIVNLRNIYFHYYCKGYEDGLEGILQNINCIGSTTFTMVVKDPFLRLTMTSPFWYLPKGSLRILYREIAKSNRQYENAEKFFAWNGKNKTTSIREVIQGAISKINCMTGNENNDKENLST